LKVRASRLRLLSVSEGHKSSRVPVTGIAPFQIVGAGSERLKYACGSDAVQALQVMRMIEADLFALNSSLGGMLRWDGTDLEFPD
jgi:hypothetical protein